MADPIVIDMTEPAAPAAAQADDVVTIPAEVTDAALPAGAALQADGSVILTLRFPVVLRYKRGDEEVREERHETLHLHRLNGAAMRAVMSAGRGAAVTVGLAKSARMALPVFDRLFDRMDASDANAAAEVFSFFLSGGTSAATGQPSSP